MEDKYKGYKSMMQMAKELGVSRTRITQLVKDIDIMDDLVTGPGNSKLLSPEQAQLLKERFNLNKGPFIAQPKDESIELKKELEQTSSRLSETLKELSDLNEAMSDLKHSKSLLLTEIQGLKDTIRSKDSNIQDLRATVDSFKKALDQQQQLELEHTRAITYNQQQNVTESQSKPSRGTTEHRSSNEPKGFFGRLFK